MKNKRAIVLKAIKKKKRLLCLIHCTCGKYHITISKSKDSVEILDTAKTKKEGERLYAILSHTKG